MILTVCLVKNHGIEIFLTKYFQRFLLIKTYKKKREDILLDREKGLLPSTQPLVERELQIRHNTSILHSLKEKRANLKNELWDLNNLISNTESNNWRIRNGDMPISDTRRQFIKKCPFQDCKGFLSTQWKCGICGNKTCKDCNEIVIDDDHQCDDDKVKSVQLIKKEAKSCPSCGTQIIKLSGCDQMWCTECQTSFSWRTGLKINGTVHNPHYYEWMRQNGGMRRNPLDVPCGGDPAGIDAGRLYEVLNFRRYNISLERNMRVAVGVKEEERTEETKKYIIVGMHRLQVHLREIELPRYPADIRAIDNSDLRIKYMLNEINEEHWSKLLQQREKARERKRAIGEIMAMFVEAAADYFRGFYDKYHKELRRKEKDLAIKTIDTFLNTMKLLRELL